MADHEACNCPIVLVALGFLIAAVALATSAIYGWLAGALTYVCLWLGAAVSLFFRVRHG